MSDVGILRLRVGAAIVAIGSACAGAAARSTQWTGAGGDHLWTNPANWSAGVPDADTNAAFSISVDGTILSVDLGGATARAASVSVFAGIGSLISLTDGTLSTPLVDAFSHMRIDCALTTDAPVLSLHAQSTPTLNVAGPKVGAMDVEAEGTFTGVHTYTGRTVVRPGFEMDGGAITHSPVQILPGGALFLGARPGLTSPQIDDVELQRSVINQPFGRAGIGTLSVLTGAYQVYVSNATAVIDGDYESRDAFLGAYSSPNGNNRTYGSGTVRGHFAGGDAFSPGSVGAGIGRFTAGAGPAVHDHRQPLHRPRRRAVPGHAGRRGFPGLGDAHADRLHRRRRQRHSDHRGARARGLRRGHRARNRSALAAPAPLAAVIRARCRRISHTVVTSAARASSTYLA